jgi:hypothetical protein
MPIWLRHFTLQKISDQHDKEKNAMRKAKNKSSKSGNTNIDFANPDRSKLPSQYVKNSNSSNFNANFSKK